MEEVFRDENGKGIGVTAKAVPEQSGGMQPKGGITQSPAGHENDLSAPKEKKQSGFSFSTIPQITGETDSEKLTRVANIVEDLATKVGDVDEKKGEYEIILNFYQQLQNKINEFNRKLDVHFEYTEALRDKMEKKQTEAENATLRKCIAEQSVKLNKACDEFRRAMDLELTSVQSKINGIDHEFLDKADLLNQKIEQLGKVDEVFQKKIEDFRQDMTKACENEHKILTNYSKEIFNEEKENLLKYLKECENQNVKLIKKIPEQKRRMGLYDAVYFAMGGVCIISLIVSMICR